MGDAGLSNDIAEASDNDSESLLAVDSDDESYVDL
jgi:hypothetical protein